MPEDRTVLDHLLEGRNALAAEVERLTAAINDLDSVLGRISSFAGATAPMSGLSSLSAAPSASSPLATAGLTHTQSVETVNSPAEVETGSTLPSRRRSPRKSARKSTSRARGGRGEAPTSIRVHVLDMLGAENREFGLAEIIDHVHAAGIQAHDDAVRSITIKLMKDGRVERVGRGQYRLARRGAAARSATPTTTATPTATATTTATPTTALPVTEAAPDSYPAAAAQAEQLPAEAVIEDVTDRAEPAEDVSPAADIAAPDQATLLDTDPPAHGDVEPGSEPAEVALEDTDEAGDPQSQDEAEAGTGASQPWDSDYSPPLNLGQPWQS